MKEGYRIAIRESVVDLLAGDNTGHDIYHSYRVYAFARKIAKGEGWLDDIDDDVLYPVCMLHDVGHRKCIKKGDMLREKHQEYGAEIAAGLLQDCGLSEDQLKKIDVCIQLHDETKPWRIANRIPTDIKEALLIQDADNLEAMGVLGQLRVLLYSHDKGLELYNPQLSNTENLKYSRLTSSVHNMVWHRNIDENLNTMTAKVLAQKKKASANRMIEDLLEELNVCVSEE